MAMNYAEVSRKIVEAVGGSISWAKGLALPYWALTMCIARNPASSSRRRLPVSRWMI